MMDFLPYMSFAFALIAMVTAFSSQSEIAKMKRKEKDLEMKDSVVLKNALSQNVGKTVQFTFYEDGNFRFFDDMGYADDEYSFKILDHDDDYIFVEAVLEKKKQKTGQVLLPIKNIKSVTTEEK